MWFQCPGAVDFPFWGRPGGSKDHSPKASNFASTSHSETQFPHLSPGGTMALPRAAGEWGISGNKRAWEGSRSEDGRPGK